MATASKKSSPVKSSDYAQWIDLNDPHRAKLQMGVYKDQLILIIDGVMPRSSTYYRVINELGYAPSKNGACLVKSMKSSKDRITPSMFHRIWPNAVLKQMHIGSVRLDLEKLAQKARDLRRAAGHAVDESIDSSLSKIENITEILDRSTYLGRNRHGDKVFSHANGRYILQQDGNDDRLIQETDAAAKPDFLRGITPSDVRACAQGLLRSCEMGESQSRETLLDFAAAVLQKAPETVTGTDRILVAQAIDAAVGESLLTENATAGQAWADAAYYQEMMPGRAAFAPDSEQAPYVPAPLAIQVQRFLSDAGQIAVFGKMPGFGFGLLPEEAIVAVQDPETLAWGKEIAHRPMLEAWRGQDNPAQAAFWRLADASTPGLSFFPNVAQDGVAVVIAQDVALLAELAGRDTHHAQLDQLIKIPHWMLGTDGPQYLAVFRNSAANAPAVPVDWAARLSQPAQIASWSDLKSLVDESLLRLGKDQAANEPIRADSPRTENRYQRPYNAFSKVGRSSTMVPKNLQAALGFALARIEDTHGPIDLFVGDELGIGQDTMAERYSPEQVDAIALGMNRLQSSRGYIIGDETGIGKGRTIGGLCTWANKLGLPVVFITDRANLFSDLARDLIDIGEWERFRPLITNSDGTILNIMGDGEPLAEPLTPAQMRRVMAGRREDVNANLIMSTYSQCNGEDSAKGAWLQEMARGALLVIDEAHIAAGSDSNTAKQIQAMIDGAWGVVYSSATWAKSFKSLHIYSRALPESVNINQVISAMREDGDGFSEIFSSMLAMDGAFIRREHDLSKIDFVVEVDTENAERNVQVQGLVSEILGMMAMLSGEITHQLQRLNGQTRAALNAAQAARKQIAASLDEAAAQEERVQRQAAAVAAQAAAGDDDGVAQGQALVAADQAGQETGNTAGGLQEQEPTQEDVSALEEIKPISMGKIFTSNFGTGGAIYTTMRRTLAALSVDHTASKAIRAAQAGRRPVIVFEETGEAFVRQLIDDEIARIQAEVEAMRAREAAGEAVDPDDPSREIADLIDSGTKLADIVQRIRVPTIQDMMRNLLARLGGVKVLETSNPQEAGEDESQDGQVQAPTAEFVASASLGDIPGIDQGLVNKYMAGIDAIAEKINALPPLPILPVDALRAKFEKAGLTMGEISGRNYALQIEEDAIDNLGKAEVHARLVKRARKKIDVTQMVKAFNSAHVDVLAMNKSAATGLSIHASPRFEDSRQRELLEMQSDENPTNRIQLFGRVNRFDQVIPPRIGMMTTGLRGEMRTIMMQNKKLTNLSANIRSSRENAALIEDVPDLLNRTGDRVCQEYLLENPGIAGRLDIPMARINSYSGLSHMVTQRVALLAPAAQDKVYEDLTVAYNDAVLENQLAQDDGDIQWRDWRAKTTGQRVVWGPTEHLELLSAFDSPVMRRDVTFVQNYQPLHWHEVRDSIAQSSQVLANDPRVAAAHVVSIDESVENRFLLQADLDREKAQTAEAMNDQWVSGLLQAMTLALPDSAFLQAPARAVAPAADAAQAEVSTEDDEQDPDDIESDAEFDGDEEGLGIAALNLSARRGPKRRPLGFQAVARRWLAVESRIPGTRLTQRLMALVSPSGKSAKFWFLDEQGQARQFLLNLDRAVTQWGEPGVGEFMTELPPLDGLTESSWQRQRFNRVWGSPDPQVRLLDLAGAANKAIELMEAKKYIALPQTGFETVEAAMAHPEHNAVKEASFRQAFVEDIISQLAPGTEIMLRPRESNNRSTSDFFRKLQIVTHVELPEPSQESVLSRWKFHLLSAGEEKPTVMSGAVLFKLAGGHPPFDRLSVYGNVYAGMGRRVPVLEELFNVHRKGEVTRNRTLLVGNMFQASEWARDSKQGVPILYSDETGQRHRAIEIKGSNFMRQRMTFPLRLHSRSMIQDFFDAAYGYQPALVQPEHPDAPRPAGDEDLPADLPLPIQAPTQEPPLADPGAAHQTFGLQRPTIAYTSFRGALVSQRTDRPARDAMLIDVANNAIGWMIDKEEKDKIRRVLRTAINADKKTWESEHPDEVYPGEIKTHLPRASKNKQTQLTIKLPDTPAGRARFLDLFIRTVGLQLFVPQNNAVGDPNAAYPLARQAEQAYYARLAAPGREAQEQKAAVRARREATRAMMQAAFATQVSQAAPALPVATPSMDPAAAAAAPGDGLDVAAGTPTLARPPAAAPAPAARRTSGFSFQRSSSGPPH